jgi:hypothetical protein
MSPNDSPAHGADAYEVFWAVIDPVPDDAPLPVPTAAATDAYAEFLAIADV